MYIYQVNIIYISFGSGGNWKNVKSFEITLLLTGLCAERPTSEVTL